jgi:hypothetical protein
MVTKPKRMRESKAAFAARVGAAARLKGNAAWGVRERKEHAARMIGVERGRWQLQPIGHGQVNGSNAPGQRRAPCYNLLVNNSMGRPNGAGCHKGPGQVNAGAGRVRPRERY